MSVTCNKTANTKKLPTDLCRALGHRCSAENTGKSTSSFKVGTEASLKEIIDSLTVLLLKNWTDYDRPVIPFNTLTSTVAVRVQLSVKSAQMSKITNDGLTRSGTGCQDCIAQCLTSPPTQYRLYGRRFLQVTRQASVFPWQTSTDRLQWIGGNVVNGVSSFRCALIPRICDPVSNFRRLAFISRRNTKVDAEINAEIGCSHSND